MTTQEVDSMISSLRDLIEEYGNRIVPSLLEKLFNDSLLTCESARKAKIMFAYGCVSCGLVLLDFDNEKIYNMLRHAGVDIKTSQEE